MNGPAVTWAGHPHIHGVVAYPAGDEGFNAQTGVYEDLVSAGVVDPTKVARTALQNASSIAALMLTTEALICEIPEKKEKPMPGGHGPEMDY